VAELTLEQLEQVNKVLSMIGKTKEDCSNITIGENGEVFIEIGKLNVKKFLKMVMEMHISEER
jgi:hypothetical protein